MLILIAIELILWVVINKYFLETQNYQNTIFNAEVYTYADREIGINLKAYLLKSSIAKCGHFHRRTRLTRAKSR